jgi:hypothetical protein
MDTNCTARSLVPTVTGNTVRSFYCARTTVRSPRKLDHGLTLWHHPLNVSTPQVSSRFGPEAFLCVDGESCET